VTGPTGPTGSTGATGPTGEATLTRYRYTAVGGETGVSGADDNSLTLSYTAGKEQVFYNGVLLVRGQDYTATSGTSIASLAALTASDVIEVLAIGTFNIADGILATTIDAKGDLLVGTANDTVARFAVGTDGQYLKANSGVTGGLQWSDVAGALAQPTEPASPADGQIWIDTDGTAPTTVVTRWTEQPAAGTTVLTGNDDYSIPLAYSPGYEQVFLNGVLLSRSGSEYTATNGTSITLASATVAGDIVEVICPLQIATTDTYTQSAVNNAFQANTNNFAAGKNKIINGDFGVWQRGTSFTVTTTKTYTADRWTSEFGGTGATRTVSRQTFTPGTAPVAGYEGQFYLSYNRSVAGTSPGDYLTYRVEDVRTFAGQTATISFWAKADASMSLSDITFYQEFGSGGSGTTTTTTSAKTITTSWARYTTTVSVPSISGKTVGTGSALAIYFVLPSSGTFTFDIWGVQLESGSTATAFQTATGTIQGELAACQRYYIRYTASGVYSIFAASAFAYSAVVGVGIFVFPVEMRTTPTALDSSTLAFSKFDNTHYTASAVTYDGGTTSPKVCYVYGTIAGATAGNTGYFGANNSATAYVGFSAEL
jgi:hypothetical protein